jgi:hypothetical protein
MVAARASAVLLIGLGYSVLTAGGAPIGNPLIDGSQDTASNLLQVYTGSPVPSAGVIDRTDYYTEAVAGNAFSLYLLRPTDAADTYHVQHEATYTADGGTGIAQQPLPTLWNVLPGDLIGHSGSGGPVFANGGSDVIYYPISAAPQAGDTITLDGPGFPEFGHRTYSLQVNHEAAALGRNQVRGALLSDRVGVDADVGRVIVHDSDAGSSAFASEGVVDQWSFFNDNGSAQAGQHVTPLILKPNGSGWEITGVGQTRTADGNGPQTFDFDLVEGSRFVGPGYSFGWKDGGRNGDNNAGTIEVDAVAAGSGAFRRSVAGVNHVSARPSVPTQQFSASDFGAADAVYSAQMEAYEAEVVGNLLWDRSKRDGAVGFKFVHMEEFTQPGYLREWEFFSYDPGETAENWITPMIVELVGNNVVVRGIGTSRQTDWSGAQTFDFDLVDGSDYVGPGYYFGWRDGTMAATNNGVIQYDDEQGTVVRYFGSAAFAVGDNLGTGSPVGRAYSVQAIATVPEPGGLALVLLAMIGFACAGRRRL